MDTHKKILIFNVNWIGDVLFSTAAIRAVRHGYPDSYIACVIPGRCLPVLEGNPHIDEIILFDERQRQKSLWQKIRFVMMLRRIGFTTVFLLHRSLSRALICFFAGIPERIGYSTPKRAWLLTTRIVPPVFESVHRIDYYLGVVRGAGLEAPDRHTEFFVSQYDIRQADDFLVANGILEDDLLVGLNPGGNWDQKRWPAKHFALLADRLSKECKAKIIITGADKDRQLAQEIAALMQAKPLIVCGRLSLKQFAVLARILNAFVTADSGPLHIANAIGARHIVALFGPTDVAVTGPYPQDAVTLLRKNTGCVVPCYEVRCPDNRCMKAITVDEVFEAVRQKLQPSFPG